MIPISLVFLARDFIRAKDDYEDRMRKFVYEIVPMPDDEFWRRVNDMTDSLVAGRVTNACDNVIYNILNEGKWNYDAAARAAMFIAAYRHKKKELYKALTLIDLGRSDDSFSDLVDMLPVCGEHAFDKILKIRSGIELYDIVNERFGFIYDVRDRGKVIDQVLLGENYLETGLVDAFIDRFCGVARRASEEDES